MRFKKDRTANIWDTEEYNTYIEKDIETNMFIAYVNGSKYSESKTLKTAKQDIEKYFKK